MNEPAKLQQVINYLRAAEAKMNEGDHISFGLFYAFIFGFSMLFLIEGRSWVFLTTSGCLALSIPVYYWAAIFRRRKSWYWAQMRRDSEGKSFREMWDTSERGDWLLWFCAHMIGKSGWPTHQEVILAACQCARLALKQVKTGETRPLKAIETTESWARGQATLEAVRNAGRAADNLEHDNAAYCAAQAARAAAWGVYAKEDGCCFRFAQAISDAASRAASASHFRISETGNSGTPLRHSGDDAEKITLRECADVVRRMLSVPNELTNELPIYRWVKGWERNIHGKRTGRTTYIPIAVSRCSPGYALQGDEIDNSRVSSALRIATALFVSVAVFALFGALGEHPIQYYTNLRWWTCLAAVMLVWRGSFQGSLKWAYLLAPVAVLFNPVVAVHLHGRRWDVVRTWQTADIVAAVILVLSLALMEMQVWDANKRRQQMARSKKPPN